VQGKSASSWEIPRDLYSTMHLVYVYVRCSCPCIRIDRLYQHGTMSIRSVCVVKIMRAYFANGTLPTEEYLCQPDLSPFDYNIISNAQDLDLEDVKMLEAMETLSRLRERILGITF
jgi:hypothetical protein